MKIDTELVSWNIVLNLPYQPCIFLESYKEHLKHEVQGRTYSTIKKTSQNFITFWVIIWVTFKIFFIRIKDCFKDEVDLIIIVEINALK